MVQDNTFYLDNFEFIGVILYSLWIASIFLKGIQFYPNIFIQKLWEANLVRSLNTAPEYLDWGMTTLYFELKVS